MNKLHRRQWLNQGARAAAVALPLWLPVWARAQASGPWLPTPAQTEGPFYPTEALNDTDGDLVRFGDRVYTLGQGRPGNCVPVQRGVILGQSTVGEVSMFWEECSGY